MAVAPIVIPLFPIAPIQMRPTCSFCYMQSGPMVPNQAGATFFKIRIVPEDRLTFQSRPGRKPEVDYIISIENEEQVQSVIAVKINVVLVEEDAK